MRILLVDNGSLQADSWINLCQVASALGDRLGQPVAPASVLHSTRIDPATIPPGWPRPNTWERAIKAALAEGERDFLVLPFFFGPTGAITEYLPRREAVLRSRYGAFSVRYGAFLADHAQSTPSIVDILADRVRETVTARTLSCSPVVLVDHGSPRREVTRVRDSLAPELADRLGTAVAGVQVASMERREGAAYDFNEPLLERALRAPDLPAGDVVLAMLFLSPGRHAGEDGDVARICSAAARERPGLQVHRTELVGTHPAIVDVLEARYRSAMTG